MYLLYTHAHVSKMLIKIRIFLHTSYSKNNKTNIVYFYPLLK